MTTIINDEKATKKVLGLKEAYSVNKLAEMLGMSKVTMYSRLESKIWKKTERALIQAI